jgi:hypothetical protein
MKADTNESLRERKKETSMLQLLLAAMPFPSSSRSKTRYKAWCTVCNHAYENRKKCWGKNIKHNMQKKDVYGKRLIFFMLKHWMVNKNIAVVFWNIGSETFIICLWNMWKQLLQHQLGELKKLKTFSIYCFNMHNKSLKHLHF